MHETFEVKDRVLFSHIVKKNVSYEFIREIDGPVLHLGFNVLRQFSQFVPSMSQPFYLTQVA